MSEAERQARLERLEEHVQIARSLPAGQAPCRCCGGAAELRAQASLNGIDWQITCWSETCQLHAYTLSFDSQYYIRDLTIYGI